MLLVWRHKLWQFIVEHGGKQIHCCLVPPSTYLLEEPLVERPLCLNSQAGELLAMKFNLPGMCLDFGMTWLLHQIRILHSRAPRRSNFIPPCLFMYATMLVLSVVKITTLLVQRCLNVLKPGILSIPDNWYTGWSLGLSECPSLHLRHL